MAKIKIRQAKKSDNDNIAKLIIKVITEIFGREPTNKDDYEDFMNFYKSRDGVIYVAQDNKKIVGSIAIRRENDNSARLRRMYVLKEYRKKGVGEKLFNKVIMFSKKKNYKRIILTTYPEMKDAIKFYEKNGFTKFKEDNALYYEKYL